jgi:rhodanese-related sulfurtransferase
MTLSIRQRNYQDVRDALLEKREIALLDVREEDPHAQAHPLFAANLPLSKIDIDAGARLPRRTAPIVVLDAGEGLAERAAQKLLGLGYTDVAMLKGGLDGWQRAGGEVFRDVNVPSKAFGEFVEAHRHTPSLSAEEVDSLLRAGDDLVVLDARRYDEYQAMNIPGSISVPGAELVLRARALAPNPATRVIVNCAGRTRSLIGAPNRSSMRDYRTRSRRCATARSAGRWRAKPWRTAVHVALTPWPAWMTRRCCRRPVTRRAPSPTRPG